MPLPSLQNLRLGDPTGLKVQFVMKGAPDALANANASVTNFDRPEQALARLEGLIAELKSEDFVDQWRTALWQNLRFKQESYNGQIKRIKEDILAEHNMLLRVYYSARQNRGEVETQEANAVTTAGKRTSSLVWKKTEETQPWDVVDSGRWGTLVAKVAAIGKLQDEITKRSKVVSGAASWPKAVASFINVLRRLKDYPEQSGMIDKVVDLVYSFVRNPTIASFQFYNFMIMGVAGTGKTRLAGILGSVMAQLGLYVYDELVEASAGDFIAGFVGQTEDKVVKFLTTNAEKVIFLDEAYSLTQWNEDHTYLEGYSPQAVAELIAFLSKNVGKIAFIAAGYEDKMLNDFLPANEGFDRRFPIKVTLGDYGVDTLYSIFLRALAQTFSGPEPADKAETARWSKKLNEKVVLFRGMFRDDAVMLLYDVIDASRKKARPGVATPVAPQVAPPRTKKGGKGAFAAAQADPEAQEALAAAKSAQDLAAALASADTDAEETDPFDAFLYPRLAKLFSAQAGAMTNLAGVASAVLLASNERGSFEGLEIDRRGMFDILLTMFETTFTGADKGPVREGWVTNTMNAKEAARAELVQALTESTWVDATGTVRRSNWFGANSANSANSAWQPLPTGRTLDPPPDEGQPVQPNEITVKPDWTGGGDPMPGVEPPPATQSITELQAANGASAKRQKTEEYMGDPMDRTNWEDVIAKPKFPNPTEGETKITWVSSTGAEHEFRLFDLDGPDPTEQERDALLHDFRVRKGEKVEYERLLTVAKGQYVKAKQYRDDLAAIESGKKLMSSRVAAMRLRELEGNQYFSPP
jgi:hypothetical protein